MYTPNFTRLKFSVFTFVIGSTLGIVSLVLRGPVTLPNIDVAKWAQVVTGSNYILTQVLTIFAYVIPYFGFWAVYAYLEKEKKVERIAFWGFMNSILGTSFALVTLGIFSFISPQVASLYLQGENQSPEIIIQVLSGPAAIINYLGGTLYLIGTALLGWAIWKSGILPKFAGLMLALHGLFLIFGFTFFPMLFLSWVLLFIPGLWIFLVMENK